MTTPNMNPSTHHPSLSHQAVYPLWPLMAPNMLPTCFPLPTLTYILYQPHHPPPYHPSYPTRRYILSGRLWWGQGRVRGGQRGGQGGGPSLVRSAALVLSPAPGHGRSAGMLYNTPILLITPSDTPSNTPSDTPYPRPWTLCRHVV